MQAIHNLNHFFFVQRPFSSCTKVAPHRYYAGFIFIMDKVCIPYRVRQCSKCPGNTEYHCVSCQSDLCDQCKENHEKYLQTKKHKIVFYSEKFKCIPKQEKCFKHPSNVCRKYCKPCQVPVCDFCSDHEPHRFPSSLFRKTTHEILSIPNAYRKTRKQLRGAIHTIKNMALVLRPVMLAEMVADVRTTIECHTDSNFFQYGMLAKAQRLRELIKDFENVAFDTDLTHICLKQKTQINRHIVRIEKYQHKYEQAISPIRFLFSIKREIPSTQIILFTHQFSMTETLNKKYARELLGGIQIKEKGNCRVGNNYWLKMTPCSEFQFTDFGLTEHMSYKASDQVLDSYIDNLLLGNTWGFTLRNLKD